MFVTCSAHPPVIRFGLTSGLLLLSACGVDIVQPPSNGGGGGGGGSNAEFIEIRVRDFAYADAVVEIPAESRVRWVSDSAIPHSVTPVGHTEFDRAESAQRGWVLLEHAFGDPGVYDFRCDYHWELGMVGRIIVLPR